MKIKVKLFATLRNGRFDVSEFELPEGCSVAAILKQLDIDEDEAAIIFINGVHCEKDSMLKDKDELAVFPPVGGG